MNTNRVLLIDIDSKIKNLALHKVERYYLDKGYEVWWNYPLARNVVDSIWVSCVFTKNRDQCLEWEGLAHIGGSGWDLSSKLPAEIERVKPRINLGFTTRGCFRKCHYCIVPEKEGPLQVEGDLLDLWDGKGREIILLDNNILGLPDHFMKICVQARANRLKLDFNQGLDHRLLTDDIVKALKSTRHFELRFAYDHPSMSHSVEKAVKLLKKHGINRAIWYVLVGFDTTFEEDLGRLEQLKGLGQAVFVQRYETIYLDRDYINLARWANQHSHFKKKTWPQFKANPQAK